MIRFKKYACLLLCLLNGCVLDPGALVFRPDPRESASPAPLSQPMNVTKILDPHPLFAVRAQGHQCDVISATLVTC